MSRKASIWVLAALAGIVVTAAITWATSRLTSQHVGLSSEPLSALHGLAPRTSGTAGAGRGTRSLTTTTTLTRTVRLPGHGAASSTTTTVMTTAVPALKGTPAGSRDDEGGGEGRSRRSGGPDD